ncbi:MAG: PEP-CTERM sorting domain-containing protein [Planctomycetota bacterium]|nr:PEP-CTERM sorting domain-containing protein [Planctomycetota bacterium]
MRSLIAAIALVLTLSIGCPVRASLIEFAIDSERSSLTAGGYFADSSFAQPQIGDSDTTSYTGTISVELTGNTIQFVAGSWIDATAQSIKMQPGFGGEPGIAKADYGHKATVGMFQTTGYAATRNLVLDLTSDPLTLTFLAGSRSFDSTALLFAPAMGSVDFDTGMPAQWGNAPLDGSSDSNANDSPSTLVLGDGLETLTIPVSLWFKYSGMTLGDSALSLDGQIVGTRIVPEPAALSLLSLGALALLRRRS